MRLLRLKVKKIVCSFPETFAAGRARNKLQGKRKAGTSDDGRRTGSSLRTVRTPRDVARQLRAGSPRARGCRALRTMPALERESVWGRER